jgi:hypothetical protein
MKFSVWYLVLFALLISIAAKGPYAAQLGVLGLTLGIFFGTVSLRKASVAEATPTNPGHG